MHDGRMCRAAASSLREAHSANPALMTRCTATASKCKMQRELHGIEATAYLVRLKAQLGLGIAWGGCRKGLKRV